MNRIVRHDKSGRLDFRRIPDWEAIHRLYCLAPRQENFDRDRLTPVSRRDRVTPAKNQKPGLWRTPGQREPSASVGEKVSRKSRGGTAAVNSWIRRPVNCSRSRGLA